MIEFTCDRPGCWARVPRAPPGTRQKTCRAYSSRGTGTGALGTLQKEMFVFKYSFQEFEFEYESCHDANRHRISFFLSWSVQFETIDLDPTASNDTILNNREFEVWTRIQPLENSQSGSIQFEA